DQMMLTITYQGPAEDFSWCKYALARTGDAVVYRRLSATLEEDGHFAFTGLLPGDFHLNFSGRVAGCSLAGTPNISVPVIAPSRGLFIQVSSPRVWFSVVDSEGVGIPQVAIHVSALVESLERTLTCYTDSEGWALVLASPHLTGNAILSKQGYESTAVEVKAPGLGESTSHEVVLNKSPIGVLALQLPKDFAGDLGKTNIVMTPDVSEGAKTPAPIQRMHTWEQGEIRLSDIPSGRYQGLAIFGVTNREKIDGAWLPVLFSAQITAGETTSKIISPRIGGKLEVRIVDETNTVLPASCILEDNGANAIQVEFVSYDPTSNTIARHPLIPHQLKDWEGFVQVHPVLQPGSLVARVELEGYVTATPEIMILEGQTVQLDVRLLKSNS
ncbi:MAG: hypothetical protein MN733_33555, partial [Nitrososphaera sp.]|nr:hypothetical protein [Nitrososphaera sp.]